MLLSNLPQAICPVNVRLGITKYLLAISLKVAAALDSESYFRSSLTNGLMASSFLFGRSAGSTIIITASLFGRNRFANLGSVDANY